MRQPWPREGIDRIEDEKPRTSVNIQKAKLFVWMSMSTKKSVFDLRVFKDANKWTTV